MVDDEPCYVRKLPKIAIEDGHIVVESHGRAYVWTPHMFMAFIADAQRVVAEFQIQHGPIPLRRKGKH